MRLQVATILILLLVGLFCGSSVVYAAPNTEVRFRQCSQDTYPDGDPYGGAVTQALNEVVYRTPVSPGYDYRAFELVNGEGTVVAHGLCTTSLISADCSTCLQVVSGAIADFCRGRKFGLYALGDCVIGYGLI